MQEEKRIASDNRLLFWFGRCRHQGCYQDAPLPWAIHLALETTPRRRTCQTNPRTLPDGRRRGLTVRRTAPCHRDDSLAYPFELEIPRSAPPGQGQ